MMKAEKISIDEYLDKATTPSRGVGIRRDDVKMIVSMEFGEAIRFTYDSVEEMKKASSAISSMIRTKNEKSKYEMYEYATITSEKTIYVKKNKKQEE